MTFKIFLQFIRLNAKAASVVPYFLGILFSIYYFHEFKWANSIIYLIAQVAIALFVTGFNNVQDYYLAKDIHYRDTYNIIGREHLSPRRSLHMMLAMLATAIILGIVLVFRTNLLLLFMGAAAIGVAVFYTYGPIPFSRFPLGELLSGTVEGFGVFFLAVYMNVPTPMLMGFHFNWPYFSLAGNLQNILVMILVGLPNIFLVANIMLADNICDLEQDIRNERYTVPYYIGKDRAIKVYDTLVLLAYIPVIFSVLFQVLPIYQLIVLLSLPIILKNIKTFNAEQVKETTFNTAPQNLMLFQGLQMLALILGIFF
ncbi:1,4-dihydroxy-2-naphthoate polyprenyltransferase [Lactiplantibacillus fabifermentans]|nr:UbiA family prenyltransferase [Lactiplantibacillus fabifermentans DSM 21115]